MQVLTQQLRLFAATSQAKYSPQGRSEICKAYLNEDRTLKDLKKHVVITSFKLDGKVGQMGAFISMNGGWRPGPQCLCFTSTKVPTLTQKLVQKYKY